MNAVAGPDVGLEGWVREVHQEQVWGTVVTFDVRDVELDAGARAAIDGAVAFLHQVDAWFSTYRMDTPITALRMGLAPLGQMPDVVRDVLSQCAYVRDLTEGVFDPWAVAGGVDPSGLVKGWAADVAADMIVSHGYGNVSVNAAGDVTCRGYQSEGQPWVIGVRHPDDPYTIVTATEVLDGAIATSGEYERGKHILDPRTGEHQVALRSATVVGDDGGLADALATALLITGTDGVRWFAGMPEWSGYLIDGEVAHFFGPAFAPSSMPETAVPDRSTGADTTEPWGSTT